MDIDALYDSMIDLDFDKVEEELKNIKKNELLNVFRKLNNKNKSLILVTFAIHMYRKTRDVKWLEAEREAFISGFDGAVGYENCISYITKNISIGESLKE